MFRIGEFAQIAQVTGRQLRYYDQLGLLSPGLTDRQTGYRYYSARQLPRLNRILALKDLGLTLDQIAGLLDREVSPTELRGMLAMKRAQVEQSLREEELRLRQIESRIRQLDGDGPAHDFDVVLKSAPEQPFLGVRRRCEDLVEALAILGHVVVEGQRQLRGALRDQLVVIAHNGLDADGLDMEFGYTLTRETNRAVRLPGGLALTSRVLPAAPALATVARSGPAYEKHAAYAALGVWIEGAGYRVDGPCREIVFEPPSDPSRHAVAEIQLPVRLAA